MPDLIEVRATAKDFRALKHIPSGEGFDERGHGFWPADSFTYRLIGEGALKRVEPDSDAAPAKATSAHKGA